MKTEDIKTWAQHQRKDGHWKSKDACMKSEIDELRAALKERDAEIEQLRVQLAGCGVAAMQNTESSKAERAKPGDYGWSESYGDVCRAVDREIELRAELAALAKQELVAWLVYGNGSHRYSTLTFDVSQVPDIFVGGDVVALYAAAGAAPVPEGWQLVPVEPTDAMLVSARDWSYAKYGKPIGNAAAVGCWEAMLAAAPKDAP